MSGFERHEWLDQTVDVAGLMVYECKHCGWHTRFPGFYGEGGAWDWHGCEMGRQRQPPDGPKRTA